MGARVTMLMAIAIAELRTPVPVLAQATAPQLILEEEMAWSVPSGFAPTRIFLCPVDRILLYSATSAEFLLLDSNLDPLARASVPGTSVPVALIVTRNDELVTFDYDPPGLSRYSLTGVALGTNPFPIQGQIVDATFAPGLGWAVLVRTAPDTLTVAIREPVSAHWAVLPVESSAPSRDMPMYITLTSTEVLLTELHSPHDVYSVRRSDGRVIAFSQAASVLSADTPRSSRDTDDIAAAPWISLPTLSLGAGYFQTLSHTGSDVRIFVRYDRSGVEMERRTVDVPLAFAVAAPDGDKGQLWGARQLNELEIVRFAWRWTQADGVVHQSEVLP